jgi:hypothetical protein
VVAAVLELLGEPLYVLAQRRLVLRLRVGAEAVATLIRCVVLYYLFVSHQVSASQPAWRPGFKRSVI